MNKNVIIIVAAVLVAALAFGGGYFLAGSKSGGSDNGGRAAFANLSAADRAKLQTMSADERTAFFKEKGITMPTGGPGGNGGMPGATGDTAGTGSQGSGMRGASILEGTVLSVASDTITVSLTAGGSRQVYVDASTVKAATSGTVPTTLAKDMKVMIFAQPEAAGVTTAKAIIVQ